MDRAVITLTDSNGESITQEFDALLGMGIRTPEDNRLVVKGAEITNSVFMWGEHVVDSDDNSTLPNPLEYYLPKLIHKIMRSRYGDYTYVAPNQELICVVRMHKDMFLDTDEHKEDVLFLNNVILMGEPIMSPEYASTLVVGSMSVKDMMSYGAELGEALRKIDPEFMSAFMLGFLSSGVKD